VWYLPHIGDVLVQLRFPEAVMANFTKGELEVMRILWQNGEMKPAEIHDRFPRKITNPSLRSYLAILLDKGHITRRRVGKAYLYRSKTRRESTFRSMLRDLARVCCDGSIEALLCHLIRSQKLSEEDLVELKRIADGRPARTEPSEAEGKS
jgi:BlaI family transcriptional regulator, penicillinase repressor